MDLKFWELRPIAWTVWPRIAQPSVAVRLHWGPKNDKALNKVIYSYAPRIVHKLQKATHKSVCVCV